MAREADLRSPPNASDRGLAAESQWMRDTNSRLINGGNRFRLPLAWPLGLTARSCGDGC
jgi:hypothetical protein